MGINCLLPFLKNHMKSVNIKDFEGKIIAVDASCWLHKALSVSMRRTGSFESYLEICRGYVEVLLRNGVVPFLVFDGLPLPAKSVERDERRRLRDKRLQESEALENMGKIQDSWCKKSQAVSVLYEHIAGLIEICIAKDIQYIVAPFEADAELAYLSTSGHVDVVLTEDSDLLAYGCKKVLFKLKLSGEADLADMAYILHELHLDSSQFLYMCIVAGCDFLPNIKGIGIHRASQVVTRKDFLNEVGNHRNAPSDYCKGFKQACAVFKHQTIYDLDSKCVRPLTVWEPGEDEAQFSMACGEFSQADCVANFVVGNIDMVSMEKKNTFPTHQVILASTDLLSDVSSVPEPQLDSQEGEGDIPDPMDVYVEKIEDGLLKWKIPCFPVMEVEFKHAWVRINGQRQKILLSKDSSRLKCPVNVRCTSHCNITIQSEIVLVMWTYQEIEDTTSAERNDPEQLDLVPICKHSNVTHTLPFKVMGVAYSKEAQDHLEAAYEHSYVAKKIVYAKLYPEPENPHDSKAIAVAIKYNDGWCKVGYISVELTKYLHAVWSDGLDFEVTVKHIKFRTTYLKVGFYITINLTRKGEWEPEVIRASKKVQ